MVFLLMVTHEEQTPIVYFFAILVASGVYQIGEE